MAPPKHTLQQRIDPVRVRELEQQTTLQSQLLAGRAINDIMALVNSLHIVREQAGLGNVQAQQLLRAWKDELRLLDAALAGIVLPSGPPPN